MADNTTLNAGTGGDVIATDDLTTLNGGVVSGIKAQRVKICFGADGSATDVNDADPLPVMIKDTNRVDIRLFAVAAAAGTTTTETLLTLTKSSGTAATATATSFVITSGKRFKITHISFATRGNTSAGAQTTTFSIRVNTAGAIATTTTPIILSARSATPATASAWDRYVVTLPGDGVEILGDGTLQFGVTTNSTYTTNAPTLDATIIGYEY